MLDNYFIAYTMGDQVALLCCNGCFLAADPHGKITATSKSVGHNELWKLFAVVEMVDGSSPTPMIVQCNHHHYTGCDHAGFMGTAPFGSVLANFGEVRSWSLWNVHSNRVARSVFKEPLVKCPCHCGNSVILRCKPCDWRIWRNKRVVYS